MMFFNPISIKADSIRTPIFIIEAQPPFNALFARLSDVLADGELDRDEAKELLGIILGLIGEDKNIEVPQASTNLPLDNPAPDMTFNEKTFVFTGAFTVGTRKQCESIIKQLGGSVGKNVTLSTDYLVIGDVGSDQWKHSSFGRKIEKAIDLRDNGKSNIAIISEHHWIKYTS